MRPTLLILIPTLALAGISRAEPAAPGLASPGAFPTLLQTPSPDDIEKFYPKFAEKLEVEGTARVDCTITATGTASECHTLAESPPGLGFGAAGEQLAMTLHFAPGMKNGAPVGGRWQTIVRFNLEDDENSVQGEAYSPPAAPAPEVAALAERYITLSGFDNQIAAAMETGPGDHVTDECRKAGAMRCAELGKALTDALTSEIAHLKQTFVAEVAAIYTADELRQLDAFLATPVGRSLIAKSPALAQRMAQMQNGMNTRLHKALMDRYCSTVGCPSLVSPPSPAVQKADQ